MVFRFHVAARQEAINAIADAEIIAVLQLLHARRHIVHKGAVGALEIDGEVAFHAGLNAGMPARHRVVVDANLTIVAAADDHGRFT